MAHSLDYIGETIPVKVVNHYEVVYKLIASTMQAYKNCIESNNTLWRDRHRELLDLIQRDILPSGSGVDCGCKLNFDKSTAMRIVIDFSYHHMNDAGMYDGWTEHQLTVTPSFQGIDLRISGKDRDNIKDYLYDLFHFCLISVLQYSWDNETESYSVSPWHQD